MTCCSGNLFTGPGILLTLKFNCKMGRKRLLYILLAVVIISLSGAGYLYFLIFGTSARPKEKTAVILLPEGSSYDQVIDSLKRHLIINHLGVLEWVAAKKKYQANIKTGRYVFSKGLSCNELVNILRSGRQSPVTVTFNNIRTINELAGRVGGIIECDSSQIMAFLSDQENYRNDGFSRETIISVFIPDSYEFFWNTMAAGFYSRMLKEYKRFWNPERLARAEQTGLKPYEVSTLASIIDSEAAKPDEKPRIAGVYLNRLKRGIPLQADPTIKFAVNDFTIKRILTKHLQVESPYNTYRYIGLPPGPIGCPSIEGIDAVLHAENHDYLYFAAKPDFSGYHNFSRTLSDHNRFAAMYRRELNRRKIYR